MKKFRFLSNNQFVGLITGSISIVLFFGIWELISRSSFVNELLFPPPSLVVIALYKWMMKGQLLIDVVMSLSRVFVGFLAGAFLGILVGMLTGRYQFVSNLLAPIFQLLRPCLLYTSQIPRDATLARMAG